MTLVKHTELVPERLRWAWVEGLGKTGTLLKLMSPAGRLYEIKMTHGIHVRPIKQKNYAK